MSWVHIVYDLDSLNVWKRTCVQLNIYGCGSVPCIPMANILYIHPFSIAACDSKFMENLIWLVESWLSRRLVCWNQSWHWLGTDVWVPAEWQKARGRIQGIIPKSIPPIFPEYSHDIAGIFPVIFFLGTSFERVAAAWHKCFLFPVASSQKSLKVNTLANLCRFFKTYFPPATEGC